VFAGEGNTPGPVVLVSIGRARLACPCELHSVGLGGPFDVHDGHGSGMFGVPEGRLSECALPYSRPSERGKKLAFDALPSTGSAAPRGFSPKLSGTEG